MEDMTIKYQGNKVYFIYQDYLSAESAYERLKHLSPHICSYGGHLNALVVDMSKVEPMGGVQ
jgi:hypothetical protein